MISDAVIVGILGFLTTLLSFVVGRRAEQRSQCLLIRASMLKPIEEWLQGVERMTGIFWDTLSSVLQDSPVPLMYSLEERRKAAQFMSEKTNMAMGILQSKSLQTKQTKETALRLSTTIQEIDKLVRYQLLPCDNEILERSQGGKELSLDFRKQVVPLKLQLDSLIQTAYSLISQIKTALT